MNVFDLYVNNYCIIFCSEQALTGKILPFPEFDFKQIKKELKQPKTKEEQKEKKEEDTETREIVSEKEQLKTSLDKNQEFKNLCQFFKIITYSVLLNLGDVRHTNVLMASEKQDDDKDIRIKLIDFLAYLIGSYNKTNYNFEEKNKFLENFLDLFLHINANIYKLKDESKQYLEKKLDEIKNFIQENPEISQILEEKVLEYIEEVFGKIEELSQETETKSKQLSSEPTTAVSSTTPPLPAQPSCDDTTKLSETLEQSEEDLKTLLEIRVKILNQFCERYKYIQKQLRKCSQSKTTETPLPETPKDAKSINKFVNPSSAEPNSGAALAAAASATLATVVVGYANIIASLAARQVRLEEMRKRITTIQERIDDESQTSTSKNQYLLTK